MGVNKLKNEKFARGSIVDHLSLTPPIPFLKSSWPAYVVDQKVPEYKLIAEYCNSWRNYGDIQDSWGSVKDIIDW